MLWSPHSHQSGAYSPAGLVLSKQWLNPECRHKRQADWVLIHQEAKQVPIQNQGRVRCCSPSSPPPRVSAPFAHITTTPILPSSQFGQFQACISFFSGSRELPALHPSGTHFGNRGVQDSLSFRATHRAGRSSLPDTCWTQWGLLALSVFLVIKSRSQ